eukprot:2134012-Amphidinium_carterae.1
MSVIDSNQQCRSRVASQPQPPSRPHPASHKDDSSTSFHGLGGNVWFGWRGLVALWVKPCPQLATSSMNALDPIFAHNMNDTPPRDT